MDTQTHRRIIRDLSPAYLAANPPVGIRDTLAAISDHYKPSKTFVEFRTPFARLPDDNDDREPCNLCHGDETLSDSEGEYYCPQCGGEGTRPFAANECFLTVYRDAQSIETLAVVKDSGEVSAWVSVSQPGFPVNQKMELTEAEQELARVTVGFGKPETDVNAVTPLETEATQP
jgi:hypothetical protein